MKRETRWPEVSIIEMISENHESINEALQDYMSVDVHTHARTHTLTPGTITGGGRCELEEKRGQGGIRTHHTKKPNGLYIDCSVFFSQKKKKKVGTNPKNTLEFLFPCRLASQS